MTRQYFGTDGVRGRVGDPPITPELVLKLGWAAGRVLAAEPALAGTRPAASSIRRALPRSADRTHASGSAIARSIACSTLSGSFAPVAPKNLMPLSSYGLCDALMTMPADRRSARVRYATAGVGSGPER